MAQTLSSKYSFRAVLLRIVALLACFECYRSLTFGENLSNYRSRSLYYRARGNKRDITGRREPVSLVNSLKCFITLDTHFFRLQLMIKKKKRFIFLPIILRN